MTNLIPRDAAIGALEDRRNKYRQDSTSWMQIQMDVLAIQSVPIIPAIDPAAIREAALREAADELRGHGYNTAVRAILALIGEKK